MHQREHALGLIDVTQALRVEIAEHRPSGSAMALGDAGAALDIGEEEGQVPGGGWPRSMATTAVASWSVARPPAEG
jgi:hypothetical protein